MHIILIRHYVGRINETSFPLFSFRGECANCTITVAGITWLDLHSCSLSGPVGTWNVFLAYIMMMKASIFLIFLIHWEIIYLANYLNWLFWKMSSWFGQVCQIIITQLSQWTLQTHIKSHIPHKQTHQSLLTTGG